jgi:Zn-dependent M28 family amino/carboxypeptidase
MSKTNWKEWIGKLDFKSATTRQNAVCAWLEERDIPYSIQNYESGKNIEVRLGEAEQYFAVSCHTDRIPGSGGANDNGAAMATCLELAANWEENSCPPLLLLFFDEEENGLKGSRAYIKEYGFTDIKFLLNLELVGMGNNLIFWPCTKQPNLIQLKLEEIQNSIFDSKNFWSMAGTYFYHKHQVLFLPDFPLYFSDAHSFLQAGFKDAITMTRISDPDFEMAKQYLEDPDRFDLSELTKKSELLRNYHNAEDNAGKLGDIENRWDLNLILEVINLFLKEKFL